MVPPSMAHPSMNSKSISMLRMVCGWQKMVYHLYMFFFKFVSHPPLHSFLSSSLFTCLLVPHPTLSSFYFMCLLIFSPTFHFVSLHPPFSLCLPSFSPDFCIVHHSPYIALTSPQTFYLRVPLLLSPTFLPLCNMSPSFFLL